MGNKKNAFREENLVKIEFDALPENQSLARAIAAAYITAFDPTVEELTELKTAVSEAVGNSIIHGYGNTGKGKIVMEMQLLEESRVKVIITDNGKGIEDIEKAREPLFSTYESADLSGMGFTVMESFVDKVFVKSEPGKGTAVTLIKNLDIYYAE